MPINLNVDIQPATIIDDFKSNAICHGMFRMRPVAHEGYMLLMLYKNDAELSDPSVTDFFIVVETVHGIWFAVNSRDEYYTLKAIPYDSYWNKDVKKDFVVSGAFARSKCRLSVNCNPTNISGLNVVIIKEAIGRFRMEEQSEK